MEKKAADVGAAVTRATASNILHTGFPRHSSGIKPTLTLPCPRLRGHCQLHFAL